VVVADPDEPPLPFADQGFDLVSSRHPATAWWAEIARVLRPGGGYFAQHVVSNSDAELYEFLLDPQPDAVHGRHPDVEADAARTAGLAVTDLRMQRLRLEFFDIGADVYLLRKVIWTVPGFSVDPYRDQLRALHRHIQAKCSVVAGTPSKAGDPRSQRAPQGQQQ
jgi:SAM-dependent methyltransferase